MLAWNTNILFPAIEASHPQHAAARNWLEALDVCPSACDSRRPGCQPRYRRTVSETMWPKSVSRPRST